MDATTTSLELNWEVHFFTRDRSHFGHQSQPWKGPTCHVSQDVKGCWTLLVNLAAVKLHGVLKAKVQTVWAHPAIWVCLKIGYIPNYSHLIGIMISKTIGYNVVFPTFSDTPIEHNTTSSRCSSTFTRHYVALFGAFSPHQKTTNPRPWSRGSAERFLSMTCRSSWVVIYLYCTKHIYYICKYVLLYYTVPL